MWSIASWTAWIFSASSFFIDASAGCELFDLEVARYNNYWSVAGHAHVDCSLPGFELHPDITLSGCH